MIPIDHLVSDNRELEWIGLEKKMKWIGLEWKEGGEIGEKSCPKLTFSRKYENTHKSHFQKTKRPFCGEEKNLREYPLAIARGARGPAPAQD